MPTTRWCAGEVLDGRWVVGEPLGSGSFGTVFAGRDALTGDAVALKRIDPGPHLDVSRREATALRLLRVPGVVRLLDELVVDGAHCLVLERAFGLPFPGLPEAVAASWDSIETASRRLLAILARVHAAGLLHLDLKPENVLVDGQANPRILDLGIAAGRAFAPWDGEERSGRGTARYAAPEQFLGKPVDARADLFAVGVMLYEALAGAPPFDEGDERNGSAGRVDLRLIASPPSLGLVVPGVDPGAERLCAALLSPDPADRPDSAKEALAMLGRAPAWSLGLPRAREGPPLSGEDLRALFRGPDRLLHLCEDAAAELLKRTKGERDRVRAELSAWVDAGLASWDGTRVALSRRDLGLLREEHRAERALALASEGAEQQHSKSADELSPGEEGRLLYLVLAGRRSEAPRESLVLAERRLDDGDIEQAIVALFEGLSILEEDRSDGQEGCDVEAIELFKLWTAAAMASQSERQLVLARQRIEGFGSGDPALKTLSALLDGALSTLASDGPRAIRRLSRLDSLHDERLEAARLTCLAVASRQVSEDEAARVLEHHLRNTDDGSPPLIRRAVAELTGRRLYRAGRFAEAAREHERARELGSTRIHRLVSAINASSSWLEAGEIAGARAQAGAARREAAELRAITHEAHATWLERSCAYRAGETQPPDRELIEAAGHIGHRGFEAQILFHEGVLAWRSEDLQLAVRSAGEAERIWRERGQDVPAALGRLLQREAGLALTPAALEELATLADTVADASLRAQLGGLLARAGKRPRESWRAALAELEGPDERRWEILSLAEMRAVLAG